MSEDFEWLGEKEVALLIERFGAMLKEKMQYFFDVDEFEAIIDYYYDNAEYELSLKATEQALLQHPGYTGFKVREARLMAINKKYYEALEMLNHVELLEPANEEIYLTKGEIYSLMNKHELAIEEYKKSIPYTDQPEEIYANIAFEFENLNDYPNTIKFLKKALSIKPGSENLIHEIAFFFEITGREDDAIEFFTEFLDKNPYSKVAWFNLGIFYNSIEFYEKAIEAYEFTLAIDETFASAYFNIANSYSGLKLYRKSISFYEETFKYEEPEAITYYYIGESYENLDELNEALHHFNKALDMDDKLAEAWAGIGRIFVKQYMDKTAIKYFQKAIELMPLNDEFKYELAMLYFNSKMTAKASELFKDIVRHDSQYIEAWINYSVCVSLDMGLEKSIDIIEEALEYNKNEATLWYRLAGLLYKTGKVQQAYFYIETALKLNFDKHAELLSFMPELNQESRFNELLGSYSNK
jgi:tetratricopeptide (TPR) repeat protein